MVKRPASRADQASGSDSVPADAAQSGPRLVVGMACPLTDGCRGRLSVLHRSTITDPHTQARRVERWLHCTTCGRHCSTPLVSARVQ